ncbi:MAG TPA: glycosyltransferase 87 family protein [Pilimelia sp.]|nr:glycosyltransferase 87 family protein [Pilimelia sp.]
MIDQRPGQRWQRIDGAAGGLALDLVLYAAGAGFAALTAAASTLTSHRAWGAVAAYGYAAATAAVAVQLVARRRSAGPAGAGRPGVAARLCGTPARALLTALAWLATALVPLVAQAVQRAAGGTGRAQEEVEVVEQGARRLLDRGTPYLSTADISGLPPAEWLPAYLPYQPGMVLFGLPRALAGIHWWTDARVWFALATAAALAGAVRVVRGAGPRGAGPRAGAPAADAPAATAAEAGAPLGHSPGRDAALVRAVQAATVLPVAALTLATGGDDLPVLALALLALACGAVGRPGAAGVAVGLAGALKLFAWPVALVLLAHAATRGARAAGRYAAGAFGLPLLALLPAAVADAEALADNVIGFPLGDALVTSPARSPLPGYLLAAHLPAGRVLAVVLLLAAGAAIAVRLLTRPPATAAAAAAVCAYGLLAAILLMPATRFGYLLYPAAFAAWLPALAAAGRATPVGRGGQPPGHAVDGAVRAGPRVRRRRPTAGPPGRAAPRSPAG